MGGIYFIIIAVPLFKERGIMVTEVIMQRKLFDKVISQKSKDCFLSLTDLKKAGDFLRSQDGRPVFDLDSYFNNKSTKEFVKKLEDRFGVVKISARGRGHHTWVHPFLFMDIAFAISPDLKIEAYVWLFDHLIAYRNDSGDSYKKMCGGLYAIISNKSLFQRKIVDTCQMIKDACGVIDWNTANEEQLKLRDKIHEYIFVITDVVSDYELAVAAGINKAVSSR